MAVMVGVTILAMMLLWSARQTSRAVPVKSAPLPMALEQAVSDTPIERPLNVTNAKRAPAAADYKNSFAQARDYLEFAHATLPAAQAGDANAQFYLWKAVSFCEHPSYFETSGRTRTLDEALQFAAAIHASPEAVQLIYDRCHGFFNNPGVDELGKAMDWLDRATQAGQPSAEATTAQLRLSQDLMKTYAKAGAQPTEYTTAVPVGGDAADPHALMRAAVESRDPEVLWLIGGSESLLNPTESATDKTINRVAWWYVACQRGFDCSSESDWIRLDCAPSFNDCRAGGIAALSAMARDAWPAAQERAQAISAKLDAGQWDELGLGTSSHGLTASP